MTDDNQYRVVDHDKNNQRVARTRDEAQTIKQEIAHDNVTIEPLHEGIELTATEWKVSASEKVSTGEYENYSPYVELEGEVPHRNTLDPDTRRELKARLLALQKDAQEVVERAGENRVSERPDWGVPKRGVDQ